MKEFACQGPVTVIVRTSAGNVDVIAEERDSVAVDITAGAMGEASRAGAAETKVEMSNDLLVVETPQARGFVIRRNATVDIRIHVPANSRLQLSSLSADLRCTGQFGDVEARTASGDLHIDHVAGDVRRNSASGDTRFDRIDGDLSAHTASGDVRGGMVRGGLVVRSASGDLAIDSVGGSVRAQTASGDVEFGSLAAGTARLHTASGDVEVGVAEGVSVWLDLNSISGNTTSELAVSDSAPAGGEAALKVHARTASGDIKVRRCHAPVPSGL